MNAVRTEATASQGTTACLTVVVPMVMYGAEEVACRPAMYVAARLENPVSRDMNAWGKAPASALKPAGLIS